MPCKSHSLAAETLNLFLPLSYRSLREVGRVQTFVRVTVPKGQQMFVSVDQVSLFQEIFTGRKDVFGTYDPQTRKSWQVKKPVTAQVTPLLRATDTNDSALGPGHFPGTHVRTSNRFQARPKFRIFGENAL